MNTGRIRLIATVVPLTCVVTYAAASLAADATKPVLSPSAWVGDTLHVAGQGARDRKTGKEPSTFEGKVRQAFENCRVILKDEGLGFADVVSVSLFLTDLTKLEAVDKIYRGYFSKNPPARIVLGVPALPGNSPLEITLIATRGNEHRSISPAGDPAVLARLRSPGVLSGHVLYLSGQGGREAGHAPSPATDFEGEVKQTLDNVRAILKAAGMDIENLVSGVLFVADFANYDRMNAVYKAYFAGVTPPSRTTVGLGPLPGGSPLMMTFVAAKIPAGKSGKEVVMPTGDAPSSLFVPAVVVGETLYLSGRAGYAAGGVVPQVDEIMKRMSQVLTAAGLDLSHVANTQVYLADMADFEAMNAAYIKYFPGRPPARTTIAISQLHRSSRVEMTLIAHKKP